jgi:glycosyltransferase involved in cell wall biosynthesis
VRLLVVNYEMDDASPVLAWQARVVRDLAARCEQVVVLTERAGDCAVPDNVYVTEMNRQPGVKWIGWRWRANRQAYHLCREHRIQVALVHMAARYTVDLSPAFKLARVPVLMWYAHGTVTWRLRLAHTLAARVVTSSPEGFRIRSRKVQVIGQGIDIDAFPLVPRTDAQHEILTVSRISTRKRLHLLIDALACLHQRGLRLHLRIIGPTLNEKDRAYKRHLLAQVDRLGLSEYVHITGPLPPRDLITAYAGAFVHVNVSATGSMDKTVLESLACGCPVLTSNPAFRDLQADHPETLLADDQPEAIADGITRLYAARTQVDGQALRDLIAGHHDAVSYANRLMEHINALA